MARRRKRRIAEPRQAHIDSLSHECAGVAHVDGKAVFINGALPGEDVMYRPTGRKRSYDTGLTVEVLKASPDRVEPGCPHYADCGGCSLQHLDADKQILAKQQILVDNLERIGGLEVPELLPPLTAGHWGYRNKARLSVRKVDKKGRVLVGFREKASRYICDMHVCKVLHPGVGEKLDALSDVIGQLDGAADIAQIEVAVGDNQIGLVFRNLEPLSDADIDTLVAFGQAENFLIYSQPGGVDSIVPLGGAPEYLSYSLPQWSVTVVFKPADFTQVNARLNERMIETALALLQPEAGEHVLELFCGLGNFSLPLARQDVKLTAVEGDQGLVERARANAEKNGLPDIEYHACDLTTELAHEPWFRGGHWDKLLLDPPRTGAKEVIEQLNAQTFRRIVYVSCNPSTLARDAGLLVGQGYRLVAAGVMDMFPHTAHVESIALFER